jgi:hypothetical protein
MPGSLTMGRRFLLALLTGGALIAALVLPAKSPAAMDAYADVSVTHNTAPCTQMDPCKTIAVALTDTSPGGTVHVAPGTYGENVTVTDAKSLLYDGSGVQFGAVINGTGSAAVTVDTGESSGTIQGFTIRSTTTALQLSGSGTVSGNLFDSTGAFSAAIGTSGADAKTISGNQITGNGSADRTGILLSGSATVTQNLFSGLNRNIFLTGGSPLIEANEFAAGVPSTSTAIQVQGGTTGASPVITRNYVHELVTGVLVQQLGNPSPVGAALSRNRFVNNSGALSVDNTAGAVTLNSDLFASNGTAIFAIDLMPNPPDQGNVTATNITLWDGSFGAQLFDAQLTLDSSIFGDAGITPNGTASCTITNSRGPIIGSGCDAFQTTAQPQFADQSNIDPALWNYHLAPSSPMIDQGNSTAPPADALDLDGDPRAIAGTCGGTARRDIGADEFRPSCPTAGGTTQPGPTQTLTTNPPCATLRKKLKAAKKRGDRPRVRKLRAKLRRLGC